ncbi:MAG: MBL fold metallo-hydrolase [Capnocytophaga sp.]|nr:MBL fold metallo-hydrolase [Capnocytophaga sp.]
MVYTLIIIVGVIAVGATWFLNTAPFGKLPSRERLLRIEKSPNYKNGKFVNLENTPQLTSDKSFFRNIYEFLFVDGKDTSPMEKMPAEQTNLETIPDNTMVWFGHSSYFMKIDNKKILIDPVFYSASPFPFMIKPFDMEYNYSPADIPEIDLLIITHDHWDHLDYKTMQELKPRIKKILCTLGVGEHFEHWGFRAEQITELDWNEQATIDGMHFTCLPTRHFSGRGLNGAKTLWGSYMLESQDKTIYIGGDSGYGKHFAEIGKQFQNIDLAILENGQYNQDWRHIHTLPEELQKVMKDLRAKQYFTGHNSKFKLAKHSWYAPIETIKKIVEDDKTLKIILPKIGKIEHF